MKSSDLPPDLVEVRLVPVEVFGTECDKCEEPIAWGLCDAVPAWSDCNRAEGHLFRLDDMDPKYRSAADVVSVWVTPEEAAKFAKTGVRTRSSRRR